MRFEEYEVAHTPAYCVVGSTMEELQKRIVDETFLAILKGSKIVDAFNNGDEIADDRCSHVWFLPPKRQDIFSYSRVIALPDVGRRLIGAGVYAADNIRALQHTVQAGFGYKGVLKDIDDTSFPFRVDIAAADRIGSFKFIYIISEEKRTVGTPFWTATNEAHALLNKEVKFADYLPDLYASEATGILKRIHEDSPYPFEIAGEGMFAFIQEV